ncbi:hypothetical protein T5B8_06271 [Salinisphaera sp. T5B8]|uniref:hypothetical protein n=1 Tax=Salinisphaera sp. T5B8 TaxID=1304154 RepID=UPI0033404A6C
MAGALMPGAMLVFAAVGFGVQFVLSPSAPGFSSFNALHFEINYLEHGFVRRALVGTLFQAVPEAARTPAIVVFGWVVIAVLAGLVTRLLYVLRRRMDRDQFRLLAVLWIAAPWTFMNLGYDFARLDQLNLLLLALSLYLVYRNRIVWLTVVSVAGLLIHEAYLFYGLIPVLAHAWVRYRPVSLATAVVRLAWPVAAGLATLVTIALAGRYEPGRAALIDSLGTRLADPNHNALNVWLRSGLDNPHYVLARLDQGLFGAAELLVMAALVLAAVAVVIGFARTNGRSADPFILSPLAVLPLFCFGIDYARWMGLIAILSLTVVTTRLLDGGFGQSRPLSARHTGLALLGMALAGPLGSVHLLPLWGD